MNQIENCSYDKIKLLHLACKMRWFIDKHALDDAKKANDEKTIASLQDLKKDLDKHISTLSQLLGKDLA